MISLIDQFHNNLHHHYHQHHHSMQHHYEQQGYNHYYLNNNIDNNKDHYIDSSNYINYNNNNRIMSYLFDKNFIYENNDTSTIAPDLQHLNLTTTIVEKLINFVRNNDNLMISTIYPDPNAFPTDMMIQQQPYYGLNNDFDDYFDDQQMQSLQQQSQQQQLQQQLQQQQQYRHIDRLVEMSYTFRTVMVIIYMLTAIVAFVANIMAVLILNYARRTSRQLNLFLSNLGLSDIIFAIFNIPFTYITLIYNTWWLPEFLCPLTSFVQVLAPTVAFYTLIAIGIGRYYVIVTGQESLFLTKSSHTKLVIAFIWFMASFIASPILMATKISPVVYLNETYVECIEDWSFIDTDNSHSIGTIYTIIVFIMTFILPVVALTYLYGHIGLIVYKHSFPIDDDNRVTNQNLTQTKVKVLKMLLLLVISFIICWSPCQIFYLMLWIFEDIRQDPGNNVLVGNDPSNGDNLADNNVEAMNVTSYYSIIYYSIYFISHWLACSHTIMNPFIYCFCSNNFRISDISSILCCTNRQDSWINRSTYSNNNNNNNNNNTNTNNNVNIGTNDNTNNDNTNNGHDNNNHIDEIRKNPKKLFRFKSSKTTTAATMIQKNFSTTTPTMTKDLFNNNDSLKQHQHRQSKSKWLIQHDRNMHSIAALSLSSSSSTSSSSSSTIPSTSIIANRSKINDKLNNSMLKTESNKDHQDKHQNNQIYLKNNLIAYQV